MVLELSLLGGAGVSLVAVIDLHLEHPRGPPQLSRHKEGGSIARVHVRTMGRVHHWSGWASLIGYAAFRGLSGDVIAAITALAGGAMLAMLTDTMIPEAFDDARDWAGLIMVTGFLAAFVLTKCGA